ncbi:MAG TPA: hypothetical protein VFV09_12110 [Actinomycetota bacterium]|jgi:hypothetical protein|nr:hypothetical protein [Actinomycetota bacterium]
MLGLTTGVIGVVTGLLGALFIVRPNLAPSTGNLVEIAQVAVEPNVTLDQYLNHPTVERVVGERDLKEFRRAKREFLDRVGGVVHFDFRVNGVRNIDLAQRWSVFDADSGKRLGESEDLDPLPLTFTAEKKDDDLGSWEFWVDTTTASAARVFVRIELFDRITGSRLVFKDTEVFSS